MFDQTNKKNHHEEGSERAAIDRGLMNHTGENVGTRGPPQVELRVCELGERLKLLKTIINLQRCLSLLWIKNGKKIPGIQYTEKCLVHWDEVEL